MSERQDNYYNIMSLFKDVIDSALPGNESTSKKNSRIHDRFL